MGKISFRFLKKVCRNMDFLNKTLFASSSEDLKLIYEEEHKKLCKNELVLECLTKLRIEDFKNDIPEKSKKNIENALLALRISDHLDIGCGQTLLDLENFQLSNINLTYSEQRMIKEKIEIQIANEIKRRSSNSSSFSLKKKISSEQKKFIELEKENQQLMLALEELKMQELDLLKQVSEIFIGSDQKEMIKGLKQDVEILELRTKNFINITEQSECTKTKYSHDVLKRMSSYLDELIEKKNSDKK